MRIANFRLLLVTRRYTARWPLRHAALPNITDYRLSQQEAKLSLG